MKQEFDICSNCMHLKEMHVADIGECISGNLLTNAFDSDYQECMCKQYAD